MRRIILGCILVALTSAGLAGADRPRRLDEAITAQERLTRTRPGDARAFNDLGNLLTLAGDLERAKDVYRMALELSPEDSMIHYNLGLLHRLAGRHRAAVRELKRAVKLDDGDAWGHFQLALLLEEKGRSSGAVAHYARAFLLQPELAELEVNPQLLDSRLVQRAMTVAYTERVASLEMAPRQYRQPNRITRLLVPESRRKPKGDAAPAEEAPAEGEAGAAESEQETEPAAPKRPRGRRRANPDTPDGG